MVPLLLIDLAFLSSNLLKLLDGGYVPLVIAGVFFVLMWTWVKGTRDPVREDPQDRRALPRAGQHAGEEPAAPGEGHRRVPDERSRHRAGRSPAQPQAQQGAAREERRS